jgi:hypothetical protein
MNEFVLFVELRIKKIGISRTEYAALLQILGILLDVGPIRLLPKSMSALKRTSLINFRLFQYAARRY